MYVEVAVFPHRIPITKRVPRTYTYAVPEDWPDTLSAGCFVLAPFGRQGEFDRLVSGVVVRVLDQKPDLPQVKVLEALLHPAPVVSPLHLELAHWISESYLEPLSNCVRLFAPPGQSLHSDIEYTLKDHDAVLPKLTKTQADVMDFLRSRGPQRTTQINATFKRRNWKAAIEQLLKTGWVTQRRVLPPTATRPKHIRRIDLALRPIDFNALPGLGRQPEAARRRSALEFLEAHGTPIDIDWLAAETGCNSNDLKVLQSLGLIVTRSDEVLRDPLADQVFAPAEPPALTNDQALVWNEIQSTLASSLTPHCNHAVGASVPHPAHSRQASAFLLHGITGSGKTEIYLRAVADVLKQGQQAIVLVPEISLTAQTIRRFAVRFPDRLAVWHSELSLNERYDTWRRIQLGQVDVVVGARSALFLPFNRLGLIVLDEEHDASYKQHEEVVHTIPIQQPLYHARDVAIELARLSQATVILGSATPSLEAWQRAGRGEFKLLTLSRRILGHVQHLQDQQARYHLQASAYQPAEVDAARYTQLPQVDIVDLRAEIKSGNPHIFSRRLQSALSDVLKRGEQAILFMNRRGSATFVLCRDCGYVLKCPRCDSPLTYHEVGQPSGTAPTHSQTAAPTLICHTCDHHERQPGHCPACGSSRIRYFGAGTQKIESTLKEMFPEARTLRWDRDTTTTKGAHEIILQHFINHEADVLIGTQMIAKGLDLPLVTLVGVISADTSLHLPDFRSSERTFQLLAQVAGRAGRGLLGGRAIIQTYAPDNYAIEMAAQHDYAAFAKRELEFRQAAAYPPYTRLARLLLRDASADRARLQAEKVAADLDAMLTRRGVARGSIIGPAPCFFAKVRDQYRWHIALRHPDPVSILHDLQLGPNWRIDIDPMSML